MTKEEIKEMVDNILIEEFEKESNEIKEDASLFEDLELDSLDGIDLVVALEKELKNHGFEKKIDEETAKKILKVGDIYNLIEKLTK